MRRSRNPSRSWRKPFANLWSQKYKIWTFEFQKVKRFKKIRSTKLFKTSCSTNFILWHTPLKRRKTPSIRQPMVLTVSVITDERLILRLSVNSTNVLERQRSICTPIFMMIRHFLKNWQSFEKTTFFAKLPSFGPKTCFGHNFFFCQSIFEIFAPKVHLWLLYLPNFLPAWERCQKKKIGKKPFFGLFCTFFRNVFSTLTRFRMKTADCIVFCIF